MNILAGKVAVVTGASRGVGKGIALGLAEYGATVYITGRTENDDALPDFLKGTTIYQTADEVSQLGGIGIAHRCDFSNDDDINSLFARVSKEQGRLDILVNNAWAGANHVMNGYFWNTPFWEQPISLFDDFYKVGLRSSYIASQYAAKIMVEQQSGQIINISYKSASQYWINPSHGIFKAATDKLTADIAHELKTYGVNVFSLYPNTVRTEGMVELAKYDPSINLDEMESLQFIGRCVAELALDENAGEYTGNVITTSSIAERYNILDVDMEQNQSQEMGMM